jgi:hypothetical protein
MDEWAKAAKGYEYFTRLFWPAFDFGHFGRVKKHKRILGTNMYKELVGQHFESSFFCAYFPHFHNIRTAQKGARS